MSLLSGLRVVQLGDGRASAVCGRMFADAGADVVVADTAMLDEANSGPMNLFWNHGKRIVGPGASDTELAAADLVVAEGAPAALKAQGRDAARLAVIAPKAALVLVSPYGQTGPQADDPATDLTLFYASGIARLLTGQVDDLSEPPIHAAAEQAAVIGGVAAACAGMHAVLSGERPTLVDVSIQEALATLAMTELTRAGQTGRSWRRQRLADGNGATVCILPAADGYVAISPREEKQWTVWLGVMGAPEWGAEPRFATKADRIANWDALHALMSEWSRQHPKQRIADQAQAAHVPSFPLGDLAEHLNSPQLAHRGFFKALDVDGRKVKAPGIPYRLHFTEGDEPPAKPKPARLPLAGVRVLDFSWVIAGPTATRHLAAMGAEVIKVEAPGAGDPGRASELHTVLGQGKKGMVLDLKNPEAVAVARALAARSDVLIENFATGVMERLGLGPAALQAENPNLVYITASGMGRTGPEAEAVAYGTLLQCYAGFAGLNRHPERPPRVGMAWLDPMCGLVLPFIAAAALWRQRAQGGYGVRADFSMLEAMLWSMPGPLIQAQSGRKPEPRGNASDDYAPHGAFRCAGEDDWLAVAVSSDDQWRRLCAAVPGLQERRALDLDGRRAASAAIASELAAWAAPQRAVAAAEILAAAGVPAAMLATSTDLAASEHLKARGFWDEFGGGVLPGLPWRAHFGRQAGEAPGLGQHTDAVLRDVLDMDEIKIARLRAAGALG